uniref:Uncharacterized protein n=1 Tax=Panagrellus redivivus TaxID=6233 RepID=A0A7E4W851_PANRE
MPNDHAIVATVTPSTTWKFLPESSYNTKNCLPLQRLPRSDSMIVMFHCSVCSRRNVSIDYVPEKTATNLISRYVNTFRRKMCKFACKLTLSFSIHFATND